MEVEIINLGSGGRKQKAAVVKEQYASLWTSRCDVECSGCSVHLTRYGLRVTSGDNGCGLIGNQAPALSHSKDSQIFRSKALEEVNGTRLIGLDLVKPALSHSELGGAASEVVLINFIDFI